ncbi:MAG: peptidoglycan-binding protein [Ilumatobacteraceae bacterium]
MSGSMRRSRICRTVAAVVLSGLTWGAVVDAAAAAPVVETPAAPRSAIGLQQGARGADVKAVQQALIARGVTVRGGADGVFGPATKSALITFQTRESLSASGIVDTATAQALGLVDGGGNSPTGGAVLLEQGDRGAAVKELQQALISAGVYVAGGADGEYGPATTRAVTNYQRWNGLSVTGKVDTATAAKLGLGSGTPAPAPTPAPDPEPDPPASSNPYVGLKQGDRGSKVKELQQAIMNTGITVRGGADGVFGSATKTALQNFQKVNGISQTGILTERGAELLGLGSGSAPPVAGIANPDSFPVLGERGERVRVMQQALINAGISVPGGADGVFGRATAGAIMNYQRREKLAVSGIMDDATAARLGLAASAKPAPPSGDGVSFDVFPIQGHCWFGDTWHAPRGGNRQHEGVDIIAAEGKLLYAVVDGEITKQYWDYPGALAGNGLRLTASDGSNTYYTYLHLSGFAPGISVDTKVKAGQVIGYNGNTGSSSTAHLHFEIHPKGGGAINPYPFVKAIDACDVTAPRPAV